jgi:hypothetical protein
MKRRDLSPTVNGQRLLEYPIFGELVGFLQFDVLQKQSQPIGRRIALFVQEIRVCQSSLQHFYRRSRRRITVPTAGASAVPHHLRSAPSFEKHKHAIQNKNQKRSEVNIRRICLPRPKKVYIPA